jgi:hypothetical protein
MNSPGTIFVLRLRGNGVGQGLDCSGGVLARQKDNR